MQKSLIDSQFFKIFSERKIKTVLDIGTGDGKYAVYSASMGAKVDAIDTEACPDYLKNHPNIKFSKTSVEKWKGGKKYDLIIFRSVIHYIRPEVFIAKIAPKLIKSLNSKGIIYITTITPSGEEKFFHNPEKISEALKPLRLIFKKEVKSVFEINGKKSPHSFWYLEYEK